MQGYHDGLESVEQFCRKLVEPMGEESDHIHIVALTDALGVSPELRMPESYCLVSLELLVHCHMCMAA